MGVLAGVSLEITSDDVLRHACYVGQLEDKPADAVALEKVKR